MRTHRNASAKLGDVIESRSSVSGGLYGHVIVTDARSSADKSTVQEGGHECRAATPQEIKAAIDSGSLKTHYS